MNNEKNREMKLRKSKPAIVTANPKQHPASAGFGGYNGTTIPHLTSDERYNVLIGPLCSDSAVKSTGKSREDSR
jgi:hypothetical protein